MKNNHIAPPCAFALCLILSVCGCERRGTPARTPRLVRVETPVCLERNEKSFSGIVAADQFSDLAFKSQGLIVKMNVAEGQHVSTGSIVAEIDPTDYILALDDKKAAYQKTATEKERAYRLFAKNAISQQEYENALMEYTNARIALENARNTLANTKLAAPFDGFIQKKYVENYQRVQPGEPVVCLVNPKLLQIATTIPETSVSFITSQLLCIKVSLYTCGASPMLRRVRFTQLSRFPDRQYIPSGKRTSPNVRTLGSWRTFGFSDDTTFGFSSEYTFTSSSR